MKKTKKKQKIYAFIDSQNLNLAIRGQGWILDLKKFRQYLEKKYSVGKAFFFIGYIKENENLYSFLRNSGYTLIFKRVSNLQNGEIKGNVDAELVLHAMIEFDNYDQAIIISGDGDFYCLIEYLSQKNKFRKLLIPNQFKYSFLLKKFIAKIAFMNNLRELIEYKK